MRATRRDWYHALWALLLAVSGLTVLIDPIHAPLCVGFALVGGIMPWSLAWKAAEGTELRGALVWAALAIGLGILAQVLAWREGVDSARPWAGRSTYLMVLMILAALVSVLGARSPGSGAWAILMALLVVVFLIPWLETAAKVRRAEGPAELQLASPWTIFYGLLVMAGVTNYLPTRYGPAACAIGAGLVVEYLGLTRTGWAAATRAALWPAVAWCLALAAWLAVWCSKRLEAERNKIDQIWFWFRDHWGVVWALRLLERFNRTAELSSWPVRLSWFGLQRVSASSPEVSPAQLDQAEATLRGLIRRFAAPDRVSELLASHIGRACQGDPPGR
jgi:hypothetical protein